MGIERQNQKRGNFSLSADLPLTIGLTEDSINWNQLPPFLPFPISHLFSLCCTNPTPSSFYLSNNLSLLNLTVSTPPPSTSACSHPHVWLIPACFLSYRRRRRHQSHSLIASVWCRCGQGGGQAAAGEGAGGTGCLQPPGAEVIFSSRSGSRPLHACNPVSRPEDSELTDYVD